MADLKIDNNALASRFETVVNGGLAVLDYRIEGGTIFLLHVEVPASEQGRGIAGWLSRAALEFSRHSGLKVVPRCPFIAAYMRSHPELLQPVS
jgi:predicted GNAT family acetyltransferase